MKTANFGPRLGSTVMAFALASLALTAQGQIVFQRPSIVIGVPPVIIAPAPQPVYVQQAPAVEYVPAPLDVYITNAAPADVVFVGGNTYVWGVDEYGHRVRHLYGRGDHREDVLRRHEELHRVSERNGGHLPAHGEAHAGAGAREQQHVAAANRVAAAGGHPAPAANHGPAPAGKSEPEKKH